MRTVTNTLILRIAVAIILLTHSIPSIVSGSVNDFGKLYLDQVGFAPVGLYLAWAIKLSHVAAAVALVINRYIVPAVIGTILILAAGIIMIHGKEGWFVIGGGRNGAEYSFLTICVLVTILLQKPAGARA